MAMMDYGAIVIKNGKCITNDMFTPMMEAVGWEDTDKDFYHDYMQNKDIHLNLNDNYFTYIGDKENTIAFYKEHIVIVQNCDGEFFVKYEYFNCTYYRWNKWVDYLGTKKVTVTKRNGFYVLRWKYRGDKYKVYFGHGVDVGCYKKHHWVNYYKSPWHTIDHLKYFFSDKKHITYWVYDKIDDIDLFFRRVKRKFTKENE